MARPALEEAETYGECGTCHPPADGTHDREVVDRFRDFLEAAGPAVSPADVDAGRFRLRSPANRYHVRLMAWRVGQVPDA